VEKPEKREATVNKYGFREKAQNTRGRGSVAAATGKMAGKAKVKRSTTPGKQKAQSAVVDEGSDGEFEDVKGKAKAKGGGEEWQPLTTRRTRAMEAREKEEQEKKRKEEEGLLKGSRGRRATRRG